MENEDAMKIDGQQDVAAQDANPSTLAQEPQPMAADGSAGDCACDSEFDRSRNAMQRETRSNDTAPQCARSMRL